MGKRLGELTRENTKCMVKVHEQTLIERMIGQLERLALRRIIIVIGYKGEKVRDLLGNKINNTPIIYISNPIYDKTNNIYSLYPRSTWRKSSSWRMRRSCSSRT